MTSVSSFKDAIPSLQSHLKLVLLILACPMNTYMEDWSTSGVCLDCPENSRTTTVGSTNRQQCICDGGYEGPNGGPCQGKHDDQAVNGWNRKVVIVTVPMFLLLFFELSRSYYIFKRCYVLYQTFQSMDLVELVNWTWVSHVLSPAAQVYWSKVLSFC